MGEKGMESQATSTATRAVPNEALRAPSATSAATIASGALAGGGSQTSGGPPPNEIKEGLSRVAEPPKG